MEGHHCKDCGLNFDSVKSLDVHLHYHKENLLMKWGQPDEANNNNAGSNNKRVTTAPADSSDGMIKQEPGHSSSPQPGYNHPPTPGSYSSAPSPYQDAFSTSSQQNGGTMNPYQQFGSYLPAESFFMQQQQQQQPQPQPPQNSESNFILGAGQDFPSSSSSADNLRQSTPSPSPSTGMYRYHPYQQHYVPERNNGVSSSGPSPSPYQPPPTPQQCDKCGYVCHSSTALVEHLNTAHPPSQSPAPFIFPGTEIKTEDKPSAEILDLDSHKVHHVFQPDEKAAAETNGRGGNPHSVSGLLWGAAQRQDIASSPEFQSVPSPVPQPPMQFQRGGSFTMHPHLQQHSIASSLPPPSPQQQKNGGSQSSGGQTWKSNEARRPKTYNCSACNKWFTSSGHLKRHYNTTLHKNAVKQSGAPDPANQPISNHHHPGRSVEMAPSPRQQSPAQILAMTEDSSRSDDANSNGNLPTLNQQATSPPNLMAGPPISMEAQTEGLPFFTSNESNLLHNPSISVHTSPHQEPALLPPMQPQHTTLHPYTLPQVASPPAHPLIHHPIPQHQIRHPTPPSTLPMTEMFSPNGQPPHISTHQQHQPMLPISISHHHLIPTIGNYGSNGDAVSSIQEDHQFLYPVTSTSQQHENSPLPSFAQFGHHTFGANAGFGELTSSYPSFGMASVESVSTAIDNVGGLLSNESQHHLLVTMKPEDSFWMNSFDEQDNMLDDGSNTLQSDSNTSESSVSPAISPQSVEKEESKITTTAPDEMPLKAANLNINNNNTIRKNKNNNVTVTASGQHICIECDKVFNRACYLTQHNKSFHAGHKPFKCDRCGKRFTTEYMYTEHLGKHAGEKPHKCDACPKQFNHKTDLRRHMCLHTGEKPYACHICGKGFIRKDHMLKHCETHRRKTGHHHHHHQNNHLKNLPVVMPVAQ